jgi:hypothetical protein
MEKAELEELLETLDDLEMIIVFLATTGEIDVPSALHHTSQALRTIRVMIAKKRNSLNEEEGRKKHLSETWDEEGEEELDRDLDKFIENQE